MAKSSMHIAKGGGGFLAHNSRERETKNSIFRDEQNYFSATQKQAFETYHEELKTRSAKYKERTGQNLQKNAITHLSAILNLNKNHTEDDMQKIVEHLEEKLDTKVFQFAIHRDEGHINDDGNAVKNYHAHIEFLGLDTDGASVRKKLTRKVLSDLQTEVADILEMERGQNFNQEFAEYKQGKIEEKPKRPKRLDTYEFKHAKEQEQIKRQQKAKVKDVQEQYKADRESLKGSGEATQEDYKSLKAKYDELKEEVKTKDVSIEELEYEVTQLRKDFNEEKAKRLSAEEEVQELKNSTITPELQELRQQVAELKATMKEFGIEIETPKTAEDKEELTVEQEIKLLRKQVQVFSQKIANFTKGQRDFEEINKEKDSIQSTLEGKNNQLREELIKKEKIIDSKPNMNKLKDYIEQELGVKIKGGKLSFIGVIKMLVIKLKEAKEQISELIAENVKLKTKLPQEPSKLDNLTESSKNEVDRWWEQKMKEEVEEKPRGYEGKINEIPELYSDGNTKEKSIKQKK